jgi:DNA processing protein
MAPAPRTIRIDDADYPAPLRRLARPPEVLYVEGSLDGLERAVGIVGTRRATRAALELTRRMAGELAEDGVVVVSGGAEGIDRAAHEGAMDANEGRTIAVLPTPMSSPYPRAHAALFARIAQRGARLSEHPDGTPTRRGHFVQRNRVIAGLARAVLVVQAPVDSGALQTAADARALDIPVLIVPWSPTELAAIGGLELLAKGATLCRGAADVLRALGEQPRKIARAPRVDGWRADEEERALLACLDESAVDRETLLTRVRMPAARAVAALMRLVIEGVVIEDARGISRR